MSDESSSMSAGRCVCINKPDPGSESMMRGMYGVSGGDHIVNEPHWQAQQRMTAAFEGMLLGSQPEQTSASADT